MDTTPGPSSSPFSAQSAAAITAALLESGQFGLISPRPWGLEAAAAGADAFYRIRNEADGTWIALVTSDRWLSQSIEQQLVHTGDKLEDLLEEELIDLDSPVTRLKVEHFRDEEKFFTFRSKVPVGSDPVSIAILLRGYEACFRRLGDMEGGE